LNTAGIAAVFMAICDYRERGSRGHFVWATTSPWAGKHEISRDEQI
jgi:hypothetical protein